jgi:hypothetical protein
MFIACVTGILPALVERTEWGSSENSQAAGQFWPIGVHVFIHLTFHYYMSRKIDR